MLPPHSFNRQCSHHRQQATSEEQLSFKRKSEQSSYWHTLNM